MGTINERIKELRSQTGKSLKAFGEIIGVSDAAISLIENGKRNATDIVIKSICREFGVNELWLRTGEGDPHDDVLPLDEDALLVSKYTDVNTPLGKAYLKFLKVYDRYPDDKKPIVNEFIESLLKEFEK